MTILTFYNSETLAEDNQGELGILDYDHKFIPLNTANGNGVNGWFLRFIGSIGCTSLKAKLRSGTATFRKENKGKPDEDYRWYWYAYKKLNGKLNKVYVGTSDSLTEERIEKAVELVNTPKVTHTECVTKETPPIGQNDEPLELAGHKKNSNHLQTNLVPAGEELSMVKSALAGLQATYQTNQIDYMKLHEELRTVQRDRLAIIQQRNIALNDLKKLDLDLEREQESVQNLINMINSQTESIQSLEQDVINFRDEATKHFNELEQCQWEASRREEQVQGYYFMHEELTDKVFNFNVVIEKYRNLAKGKQKAKHPRYAYLIDFLAEIDNLS